MKKSNRQDEILKLLKEDREVKVTELAIKFQTSELTIRKDLNELYEKGKIHRVYGGATMLDTFEEPFLERKKKNSEEKNRIGQVASRLVNDTDSIFIDNGTTTEHLAESLSHFTRLSVITTGLNIVNCLHHEENITVYVPEGRLDHRAFSIVGAQAEASLRKYMARMAFLGCDGLTIEQGILYNSCESVATSKILIENSQIKVLLCDSSKMGNIGSISLCPLTGVDIIITDNKITEEYKTSIEKSGVKLIIV